MTNSDLIKAVATGAGITQAQAGEALKVLKATIVNDVLQHGNSLTLPDLGTFKQQKTAARVGRNPATGGAINIPAKTKLAFKMASNLK